MTLYYYFWQITSSFLSKRPLDLSLKSQSQFSLSTRFALFYVLPSVVSSLLSRTFESILPMPSAFLDFDPPISDRKQLNHPTLDLVFSRMFPWNGFSGSSIHD